MVEKYFLLYSRKGLTRPFSVDEGIESRYDLIARFINSALLISNNIRRDTKVLIVLDGPPEPPKTIVLDGNNLKELDLSELKVMNRLSSILRQKEGEFVKGAAWFKKSFEANIKEFDGKIFYLDKKGIDIRSVDFKNYLDSNKLMFVIGDFIGLHKKSLKFLERRGAIPISLGPVMLFSSHCPILIQNELDRQRI